MSIKEVLPEMSGEESQIKGHQKNHRRSSIDPIRRGSRQLTGISMAFSVVQYKRRWFSTIIVCALILADLVFMGLTGYLPVTIYKNNPDIGWQKHTLSGFCGFFAFLCLLMAWYLGTTAYRAEYIFVDNELYKRVRAVCVLSLIDMVIALIITASVPFEQQAAMLILFGNAIGLVLIESCAAVALYKKRGFLARIFLPFRPTHYVE
jgi:hypothetical protein